MVFQEDRVVKKSCESLLEAFVNDVDYPVLREPSEDSGHATSQAKLRLRVDVEEADTFICSIWRD